MTYHAKNGRQLSLFIKFLASSGCREQEALKIQKEDVDLKGELISIRATNTKSGKKRVIHLNAALTEVLKEILGSLPPETQWLFPSPRRGMVDRPADSLRQSFVMVRKIVGLPEVGFHHFRHYFASRCVMAWAPRWGDSCRQDLRTPQ
jgi:integrase